MLLLLCTAQFAVVLDTNIVNVALPSIKATFGFSDQGLQWILTAYLLTFGGFLMLGGRAADLWGSRRLFVLGMTVSSCASLVGGVSSSGGMLTAARAVQGLGAACAFPAALALITTNFREGPERNSALGVYGVVLSTAFVVGVILGGLLTEVLGWRSVMFVNVPIGLVAAALAPRILEERRVPGSRHGVDALGAVSLSTATLGAAWGVAMLGSAGWGSPRTLGGFALALVGACLFVAVERHHSNPLVPLTILRRPTLLLASSAAMLTVGTGLGVTFLLTLYMQDILGYTPLETGLSFSVFGVLAFLAGAVAPRWTRRVGVRYALVGGLLSQAAGVLILVWMTSGRSQAVLLFGTAVFGFGHVSASVAFTILGTSGVPGRDQGVTSGILTSAQEIGGGLGLAVLVTVASARTNTLAPTAGADAAAVGGFQYALFCGAMLSIAGGAIVAYSARSQRGSARVMPQFMRRGHPKEPD